MNSTGTVKKKSLFPEIKTLLNCFPQSEGGDNCIKFNILVSFTQIDSANQLCICNDFVGVSNRVPTVWCSYIEMFYREIFFFLKKKVHFDRSKIRKFTTNENQYQVVTKKFGCYHFFFYPRSLVYGSIFLVTLLLLYNRLVYQLHIAHRPTSYLFFFF